MITRHGLLLICLSLTTTACRTPAPSSHTTPPPQPTIAHPWPMTHHDAARSGGSMNLPFQEVSPAAPLVMHLRGGLSRFNAPVVTIENTICTGSTGLSRGLPDEADGVTCFDPDTQQERWFTHTSSDALGTSLGAEHLFVGTLAGQLMALDLARGEPAWTHEMPGAITASPLVIQGTTHAVFIADDSGHMSALSARTGEVLWHHVLDGGVTSGLSSHGDMIFAATTTGHVYALDRGSGELRWHRQLDYMSEDGISSAERGERRTASIEAAPVIARDRLIIAYIRQQAQSSPPIMALDPMTGDLIWEATARTPHHSRWHNQHVSPVFVEDRLLFTEPYSKLFASVDLAAGDMKFLSSKPSCIQQQWSSLVHASDISYAPRHDGVLYTVSQQYGLSPWYVVAVDPTRDYFERFKAAYRPGDCLAHPPDHDGFLTTPALTAQGHVVMGRADGALLYYTPGDQ